MQGLPVYLVFLLTPLAWGCSKESPSPDKTFDKERLCDSTVREGKYCLTANRLTVLFDGIRIGDDGKDTRYHVVRLAPQQPGHSQTTTLAFGSTEVVYTQVATKGGTSDIRINDYRLCLVEDGKALEIDGKSYRFDEPHTIVISKEGKVLSDAPR
jgi:hypothetical protein